MKRVCLYLCCSFFLCGAWPSFAQNSQPPAEEGLAGVVPKDIHTRAKLHTELASMYFQDGNLIVALEELTIAISINPDYAPAYGIRGLVLFYAKEWESADKDFRQALSLDEKNPEINNNYGWFLCQTGEAKEAISYIQRAINNALYQTPEVAQLNIGECFLKLGDLDAAENAITKNLRFAQNNPKAYVLLGQVDYQRGNLDAVRKHLMNAMRLGDASAEALWLLLRTERRLGDRAAEQSLAAQLRRKYPDSPEYLEYSKGNFE